MHRSAIVLGVFIAIFLSAAFPLARPAFAFTYETAVLEKKDIGQLSDEKLIDGYMDVLVEIEASKSFHSTSSYTPKEYKAYKELLKYRLLLLMEIHGRNLEIPSQFSQI